MFEVGCEYMYRFHLKDTYFLGKAKTDMLTFMLNRFMISSNTLDTQVSLMLCFCASSPVTNQTLHFQFENLLPSIGGKANLFVNNFKRPICEAATKNLARQGRTQTFLDKKSRRSSDNRFPGDQRPLSS